MTMNVVVPRDCDYDLEAVELPLLKWQYLPPREGELVEFNCSAGITLKKTEGTNFSDILIISFDEPLRAGDASNLRIFFGATPGLLITNLSGDPVGKLFHYSFHRPNLTVSNPSLRILLPLDSYLRSFPGFESSMLNPLHSSSVRHNPQLGREVIEWDLSPGGATSDSFFCTYSISATQNQGNDWPITPGIPPVYFLISNALSISVAFLLTWFLMTRRTQVSAPPGRIPRVDLEGRDLGEKDVKRVETVISQLNPEELGVMNLVMRKGGSLLQTEISPSVGFSKSKVSRTLKKLENMGIVDRSTYGRTKKVSLAPIVLAYLAERGKGPRA